ncbi:hypothetical protein H2203_008764 [Taxawa tesnikishii (nom. ined.)]|nr:hypothetical protein H2203_008764 [Dothideales sp. JES 119]
MEHLDVHDIKAVNRAIFRFLDLPAEIRNEIYQLLLAAPFNHDIAENPDFELHPTESEPIRDGNVDFQPYGLPGTIQGVCARRMSYNKTVLKLNRQTHGEAMDVLKKTDSYWLIVSINVDNYSAKMRAAGFPVLLRNDGSSLTKPLARFNVSINDYPTLTGQQDTFIIHPQDLAMLARALWLTRGKEVMDIHVDFVADAVRDEMLKKRIHTVIANMGFHIAGQWFSPLANAALIYEEEMERPPCSIALIMNDLIGNGLPAVNQISKYGNYTFAEGILLNGMAVAVDYCKLAKRACLAEFHGAELNPYGNRFDAPSFIQECRTTASTLAMVRFELGKYQHVIKHCAYVLNWDYMLRINCATMRAHYYRGLSYSALKNYKNAIRDLDDSLQWEISIAAHPCHCEDCRYRGPLREKVDMGVMTGTDFKANVQKELEKIQARLVDAMPTSSNPMADLRKRIAKEREEAEAAARKAHEEMLANMACGFAGGIISFVG